MRSERGMTLLEVMVAAVLMAIAVVGLLSSLSTSMRAAGRLTDYDRATLLARQKMDELIAAERLPKFAVFEGQFDNSSGWRAQVTPFEAPLGAPPGTGALERVQLEVWWQAGDNRRTFTIDGYRRVTLQPEDVPR